MSQDIKVGDQVRLLGWTPREEFNTLQDCMARLVGMTATVVDAMPGTHVKIKDPTGTGLDWWWPLSRVEKVVE